MALVTEDGPQLRLELRRHVDDVVRFLSVEEPELARPPRRIARRREVPVEAGLLRTIGRVASNPPDRTVIRVKFVESPRIEGDDDVGPRRPDHLHNFEHDGVAPLEPTIERAEETSQGTWLYLRDGEQRLVAYLPMSFGGSLRDALGEGQMQFEVELGERKLTPLGAMALEMMPHQISKTHYFDQPIPIEPPPETR